MLDPQVAGGGCLRNIGLHGIDAFLHLFGANATVTGAQLSFRAHGARVEDYAAVLLGTPGGVLATIEVGNTFPGNGADAEWKLSGRDALLALKDGSLRCLTASGEELLAGPPPESLAAVALRDALARWQADEPPLAGPEDCYRAMRVVDEAYAIAKMER
jgi:predicted dehydrogenase